MRVIDLSSYVSGPFAGMMLADLAAEVIKVEQPKGGDPTRRIGRRLEGGVSGLFFNINRNKRSIALDLKVAGDVATLLELVERSDVIIENWRPGVAERLGLGSDVLHNRNPRLIHLALSGYGLSGPLSDQGALDPLLQGISGISWFNKHDGVPEGLRFYVADKVAAVYAVQSILGALLLRAANSVNASTSTCSMRCRTSTFRTCSSVAPWWASPTMDSIRKRSLDPRR